MPAMSPARTATAPLLRQLNGAAVLEYLMGVGEVTGSDIMDATALSRPTVHAACDELIARGWVTELPPRRSDVGGRPGRPARCYTFDADAGSVLGVDLGEWKVSVLLADLRGRPIAETTVEFAGPQVDAHERIRGARGGIRRVLREARTAAGPVLGACVGVAASVRPDGKIYPSADPDYLPGLADMTIATAIGRGFGWPVRVENDANLAVLAEHSHGAARGCDDVVLVLAGERMGAGILVGGRLVRGSGGAAGELGFLQIVEAVGGTHGIGAVARMAGQQAVAALAARPGGAHTDSDATRLVDLVHGDPDDVTGKLVATAARHGDPTAQAILTDVSSRMAKVVGVLAGLLNPEVVVIAGGGSGVFDLIHDSIQDQLPSFLKQAPRLEASALGEGAVVIGAVQAALDSGRLSIRESLG
jgi:predicted NBD/HSP70 family sugar kinase